MTRFKLYRVMASVGLLLGAAGPVWSQDPAQPAPAPPPPVEAAPAPAPSEAAARSQGQGAAPTEAAAPKPSVEDIIGLTAARERLGRAMPIGRGVVAGHVEGVGQKYVPNWHSETFKGTLFVQRSGQAQVFPHANNTASVVYGQGGLAPGIRVVHCFSTAHWLMDGYLKTNSGEPPAEDLPRVFNHSWIAEPPRGGELVLRRVDYQIDQRDVIMCVGVNNGRGSEVPALLGSSYNAIAVGSGPGDSSGGYTRFEVAGRCKPDIVAPRRLTSMSTPVVTACVARLLEAAANVDPADRKRAGHSELIKAVLLAGASKPAGWAPAAGKPLDEHLGAGMVNIDQSLQIIQAGSGEPGPIRRRYGWDFRPLKSNQNATYRFTTTQPLGEASIMLVWNRRVRGLTVHHPETGEPLWVGIPRLANFDLRLIRVAEDGSQLETIASSTSTIDNIEHLHLPALQPGEYVIDVQRQADGNDQWWDYALAWRFETAPADAPTIDPAPTP